MRKQTWALAIGVCLLAGCGRVGTPLAMSGANTMRAQATDQALEGYVTDFYHLMFNFIDTNHDQRVDRQEADAKGISAQAFDQMDLDHDGYLVFDELVPSRDITNGVTIVRNAAADYFPHLDVDGNGLVSSTEYQAKADIFRSPVAVETLPRIKTQAFSLADENHDRTISRDELETLCGYVLSKGYRYTTKGKDVVPFSALCGRVPALTR